MVDPGVSGALDGDEDGGTVGAGSRSSDVVPDVGRVEPDRANGLGDAERVALGAGEREADGDGDALGSGWGAPASSGGPASGSRSGDPATTDVVCVCASPAGGRAVGALGTTSVNRTGSPMPMAAAAAIAQPVIAVRPTSGLDSSMKAASKANRRTRYVPRCVAGHCLAA
jgi:hypothetical protein